MKGLIYLEDGTVFRGYGFGYPCTNVGELVFNMLILVGTIKMADRVVREMMGL